MYFGEILKKIFLLLLAGISRKIFALELVILAGCFVDVLCTNLITSEIVATSESLACNVKRSSKNGKEIPRDTAACQYEAISRAIS